MSTERSICDLNNDIINAVANVWTWFTSNLVWGVSIFLVMLALLSFYLRHQARIRSQKNGLRTEPDKKINNLAIWAVSSIELIVVAVAMAFILIIQQKADPAEILEQLKSWLFTHGPLIIIIIISSYLAYELVKTFLPQFIERSTRFFAYGDKDELARRTQTVSRISVSTLGVIITITAILMILEEFGFGKYLTPLLAGAGIAGIAIGFGAQSLIKDLLNGAFIILEDQYRRGDVVKIADISGLVEDVNLRRTVLRDLDGTVHTIPNSLVGTASNLTKEWARVNLDIPIAYGQDVDRAMEIINRVGKELAGDVTFGPMITGMPRAIRIDGFKEHGVIIKVLGVTKPLKQWDVSGEMQNRIRKAFEAEGFEISEPRIKIHYDGGRDMSLICKACSGPNLPGSRFCSHCGAALERPVK